MIINVKKDADRNLLNLLVKHYDAFSFENADEIVVVTSSAVKSPDEKFASIISNHLVFDNDIQLASKTYIPKVREIQLNESVSIGGDTSNTVVIAGPCSVESEAQITETADFLSTLGVRIFRGGAYKPRTHLTPLQA